jgi:hypothetical protein
VTKLDPPPVLDSARVLAYAVVDESVIYSERGCLFVDGKLLGPVPRLAICQKLGESEIMVFHCDNEWNVLGVAGGYSSVRDAKAAVESAYRGLSNKWADTSVTEDKAREFLKLEFSGEKCSFCGRLPIQAEQMISKGNLRICNKCVEEFHKIVHNK